MYAKVNRDVCNNDIRKCERCLGKFLVELYIQERQCIQHMEDDGNEALKLDIVMGTTTRYLVLDEQTRFLLAHEGWATILEQLNLL